MGNDMDVLDARELAILHDGFDATAACLAQYEPYIKTVRVRCQAPTSVR